MAVYKPSKQSKTFWYDFIFEGQRVRESTKTRSKKVAQNAEKARRRELEESYNGIKRRGRAKLFPVAADEWLALKALTLAPSSQRIERDNLKHIRPHFEKRLLTDIEARDVSNYQQARLAEGASPKTVNLEVGTMRAILRRARVWQEIQIDIRMLPTRDDIGHALTPEEETALLAECLNSRSRSLYVAVQVALNTCMRYSEIRLLQWKQVDFAGKIIKVGKSKTESGTGRAIPLNARILSVLEMWAGQFPEREADHFIFPFEKYGAAGEEDNFGFTAGVIIYETDPTRPIGDWKEAWEAAKKRAGVTCRFHDLRHTGCTRMLEAGIPYPIVASIMGWAASTAIRMAKRYGHIGNQALRDAADAMGGAETLADSLKKSPKSAEAESVRVQ
jgi:integrase